MRLLTGDGDGQLLDILAGGEAVEVGDQGRGRGENSGRKTAVEVGDRRGEGGPK